MKGESANMVEDKYSALGPIFADIGGELAQIVAGTPDGTYLYAEAGEGWVGASVFKDEGPIVRYYDPSLTLCDLLLRAWEAESTDPKLRWSVMEYEIKETKFDVRFDFPDEVHVESFAADGRRDIVLKRRFGDKPVLYPRAPGGSAK
jgi:hypothetical protein